MTVTRARERELYATRPSYRIRQLLKNAKARAAKVGVTFDLTPEWVGERLAAGVCEVTGMALSMTPGSALAPSLDREDPALGYTPENTRMVSWFYNRAKGPQTDAETLGLMRSIVNGPPGIK